jgi:hypothetical protein
MWSFNPGDEFFVKVLLYLRYFITKFLTEVMWLLVNMCQGALHPTVNSLFSFRPNTAYHGLQLFLTGMYASVYMDFQFFFVGLYPGICLFLVGGQFWLPALIGQPQLYFWWHSSWFASIPDWLRAPPWWSTVATNQKWLSYGFKPKDTKFNTIPQFNQSHKTSHINA